MEQRTAAARQAQRADRLFRGSIAALLDGDGQTGHDKLFEAIRRAPSHYPAVRLHAAIAARGGHEQIARDAMLRYYARFPVRTINATRIGQEPALLCVRGFSRTRLIAARSEIKGIRTTFRGGHFTTKFLLKASSYPIHRLTIAGGNILAQGLVPDHALLLNTIADPDVEAESLKTLAEYLDRHPEERVINRPEQVLKLSRDQNHRRFDALNGVRFPETHRIRLENADAGMVAARLSELGLDGAAVILRRTEGQTARKAARIGNRTDLEASVGDRRLTGEFYAIRYVQSLWRGRMFRKLRLFRIGARFYPVVCHLDHHWNVHGDNRRKVMKTDEALMAEERRFLDDWRSYVGAANVERLERIAGMVGLEWWGLDFTVDEAGDLLIYELNPAMRHSFDYGPVFPYKQPVDQRITDAFTAMVETGLRAG
mgnify:CR=1 FL=1